MKGQSLHNQLMTYWWEKSEKSFESAIREYNAGEYGFSISRLYYSVFYAVSALLMNNNLVFKKHSGVRSAFHREFIKTGHFDVKWGRLYDQLFEDRQESDYTAWVEFEQNYVKEKLDLCREFLELLYPYIIDA